MPRQSTHYCTCALAPHPHRVRDADRLSHALKLRELQPTTDDDAAVGDETLRPVLGDEILRPTDVDVGDEMARLVDQIGALALVDTGPDRTKTREKVWQSLSSYQQERATYNSTSFSPVPFSEVQRSVMAVCNPTPIPKISKGEERTEDIIAALTVKVDNALHLLTDVPSSSPDCEARLQEAVVQASRTAKLACNSLRRLKTGNTASLAESVKKLQALVDLVSTALPESKGPVEYDSPYVQTNPMSTMDPMAQVLILLGVVCHCILGIAQKATNFIMDSVVLLITMAMSVTAPRDECGAPIFSAKQEDTLNRLPSSLYVAMQQFQCDGKATEYAACPSCHHLHAPIDPDSPESEYPTHCENDVIGKSGRSRCKTPLLVQRRGRPRPIKPFLSPSFVDFLARLLSDPENEMMLDKACDDALASYANPPPAMVTNIFDAQFFREFEGPVKGKLFVDRGARMRIPFIISLDFFHPTPNGKRANADSIGLLSVVCPALPEDIRNLPQNTHISIITGPHEPKLDLISPYLRPIVDDFVVGWERGFHISSTGASPVDGRDVDVAIVLSTNDLPAGRKISGSISTNTTGYFCTCCSCKGRDRYRTDFFHPDWKPRDVNLLRRIAMQWRDAKTQAERNRLLNEFGVRWSELWRLPYWNPCRMLVIDAMHCILEGLVHYQCRKVLRLDWDAAKSAPAFEPAFDYEFLEYVEADTPEKCRPKNEKEEEMIAELFSKVLVSPLEDDTRETVKKSLLRKNNPALRYAAWSLRLPVFVPNTSKRDEILAKMSKAELVDLLWDWRLTKPLRSGQGPRPQTISVQDLTFIQSVIAGTVTPSWINHVPKNYSEAGAGSMKADEWRLLGTIYIPIALVLLWGDGKKPPNEAHHFQKLLAQSMALFQAVTIVCRYMQNETRTSAYRSHLKNWLDGLHGCHPHTRHDKERTNPHVAFHIFDFIKLYGPVVAWWCFPFERLIHHLQQMNSTGRVGGELEKTILQSYMRGANIRRWLNRADCPGVVREFKRLFDLARGNGLKPNDDVATRVLDERAHYFYRGVEYSRHSTHLGNSLVIFQPQNTREPPCAGSIQKIERREDSLVFYILRQAPLPRHKTDPFKPFPDFPATTYSSHLVSGPPDEVSVDSVISHCARYDFSDDRAVILDLSRA